jgi:CheY-like chemotaxis protein
MLSLDFGRRKVLVVEDDDRCWFLLREVIEFSNGIAIWADSGLKAVDLLKKGETIDLILMDMQLPLQDGLKTTQQIKRMHPEIPVIAQTAFSDQDFIRKIELSGCDNYIFKPYEYPVVTEVIRKVLKLSA